MNFRLSLRRRRERGINLMEIAVALVAAAFIFQQIMTMLSENARTLKAQGDAEKLRTITETAERYLAAYEDQLLVQTAGGTIAVPIGRRCAGCSQPATPGSLPTIQEAGFLPEMFVDTNSNQQSHALLVKQTPSGKLEALITTYGGASMSDEDIGYVAGLLGAAGGGVFNNAAIGPTNEISGVHGGWGDTTGNWNASIGGTNVRPSSGTVQVSLGLADVAGLGIVDESKFLHREAETDPTLNSMETDLHMDGDGTRHNIDGIANLDLQTGNASGDFEAQNLTARQTLYAGQFIDRNNTTYRANPSATSRMDNINANDLNVGSTDYLDGRINFNGSGRITAGSGLTLDGGELNISGGGNANFNKRINARQGITNYSGNLELNDNVNVSGTLSVGNHLNVSNDINGRDVDVRDVSASRNIRGSDIRGGYIESSGNIRGDDIRGDYVRSNGNMSAGTDFTAGRDITANRHLEARYDVDVGRDLDVSSDLTVGGRILGNINFDGGNVRFRQNMEVDGNADIDGNFNVDGSTRIHGGMVYSGRLESTSGGGTHTIIGDGMIQVINGGTDNRFTNEGIYTSGSVRTSSMYFNSDRRLKTDIQDIDGDMINKLRPRSFSWKKDGTPALGFIAQEVEKEFPGLVMTDDETGMKAVKYTDMIAPLVAKAQSTDAQIEELTDRIEELEAAR